MPGPFKEDMKVRQTATGTVNDKRQIRQSQSHKGLVSTYRGGESIEKR